MKSAGRLVAVVLSIISVALLASCTGGGANISLEGLDLGMVTMDGKPVDGLPSQKINLLLEVSVEKVSVRYTADGGSILVLEPSGATIEVGPAGVSINGIKDDQVKVEWSGREEE
ncbi:MAG: hypothetical protein PHU08_00595 [Dehalococcoidales bacterium]|nr:hypothetical protein [Dehalococcoidales bacterium]